ncbi:Protein NRT1/ PTR family 6.2 [Vitis vinifera]|uniref:Protein NRT1/ PTR family 6.2 n=1 Tax=Vitis vinifera TaxID=29760 RepID=A0A438C0L9_VITVI|nr:Protein NRT1/ PTR family 6.2 [Vitis vinifera]
MEMETEERKALVLDAYDYKGAPADRAQTGGWVSAATILVNLVTYLDNTMHQPSATSSTIVANFSGVSFLLCLLGGCVADSFLGRYWTIAIFAVIEALGACVLAISATLSHLRPPPLQPFGSYQGQTSLIRTDEKEKTQMEYFFNRFYFLINIGTILAVTLLVYIQDEVSRGVGYGICSAAMLMAVIVFLSRTRRYRWLDKATIRSDGDLGKNGSETPNPWRLSTQAASMDRSIGKFHVPAASFSVFFIGATMITLALYDRMVMKKSRGSRGLTNLQKIGLGLAISVIAMAVAAAMEQKRLKVIRANRNTPTSTLPLTAFILIPQFAIVGIAEAFMYSGQLAFFISEAPKGMKAISNSLFLTTISFGYFVTTILVDLIKKITPGKDGGHGWLAPKINDSRLDYFYALISVLSFINLGLYLVCARWYKPNSSENAKDSDVNASHDEEKPQDVSNS